MKDFWWAVNYNKSWNVMIIDMRIKNSQLCAVEGVSINAIAKMRKQGCKVWSVCKNQCMPVLYFDDIVKIITDEE